VRILSVVVLLASAGLSSAAIAGDPAQPAAKPVKEEKICQRLVPTGSMLPVKTCRTKAEWEKIANSGQGQLRQLKDVSSATMGAPAN